MARWQVEMVEQGTTLPEFGTTQRVLRLMKLQDRSHSGAKFTHFLALLPLLTVEEAKAEVVLGQIRPQAYRIYQEIMRLFQLATQEIGGALSVLGFYGPRIGVDGLGLMRLALAPDAPLYRSQTS
jgi:hypothetical protein